jgi:hypothetical protein
MSFLYSNKPANDPDNKLKFFSRVLDIVLRGNHGSEIFGAIIDPEIVAHLLADFVYLLFFLLERVTERHEDSDAGVGLDSKFLDDLLLFFQQFFQNIVF